jgi:predicted TPR repeat methyltransferase
VSGRSTPDELAEHWDAAYAGRGERVSWHQSDARVSLELIDSLGVGSEAGVIDVGGGTSVLAEQLAERGYRDVSVLDLSAQALALACERAGPDAPIQWLHADLLTWRPSRRYDLWHDRAVLHFLVAPVERDMYLQRLRGALGEAGAVVIGSFAPHGPDRCSGLPVARYAPDQIAELLGPDFQLVARRGEEHVTPSGLVQPFTWIAGVLTR